MQPIIAVRVTSRLPGRANDQIAAALSAVLYLPSWRIGFLTSFMWCVGSRNAASRDAACNLFQ
jgi:hypothetical protein